MDTSASSTSLPDAAQSGRATTALPQEARAPNGQQDPAPAGDLRYVLPAAAPVPRQRSSGSSLRQGPIPIRLVNSVKSLVPFQKALATVNNVDEPATVFISCEGGPVGRGGGISTMMVSFNDDTRIYLVDILKLGQAAFALEGDIDGRRSLHSILEDSRIIKFFWGVRGPADALFWCFGVQLAGAIDLQLVELAMRRSPLEEGRVRLRSTTEAVEAERARFSDRCRNAVSGLHASAIGLFRPELGGTYDVFNARPLHSAI